jgi:hypothetical protein
MLASTIDIENVDGTHTFSLENTSGNPFAPISDFDVTITDRSDTQSSQFRYKMQQSGAWPTRSYEGEMSMHLEGNLFEDTQADYWTARTNLLLACRGVPGAAITAYKRGTLFVTPEGATERWMADFGPFTFSAPVQANFVTGTPILLTLVSWTPWFIGETSGDYYWWS